MHELAWYRRWLSSTRGRVMALLRRSDRTVSELASELQLTDNAVRSHLATLERDGMVTVDRVHREGVGQPARVYTLTPEADEFFPKAYAPVLGRLLEVLHDRLGSDGVREVLGEVARREAGAGTDVSDMEVEERLDVAMELLAELGAVATVDPGEDGVRIQGYSCPLSGVSGTHPELCAMLEGLLARILGVPVRECCDREGRPQCAFEVDVELPPGVLPVASGP